MLASQSNADRIERFLVAHPLELQAGMAGILLPQPIVLSGLLLNLVGELAEAFHEVFGQSRVHSSSMPASRTRPARMSALTFSASRAS